MAVIGRSSPFGSATRTRVLLALQLLRESHVRELARLLETPLSVVQKGLAGLERDGLVAARSAGRSRLYRVNPRYFAQRELHGYLARLAETDSGLASRVAELRRRPRRSGKPL